MKKNLERDLNNTTPNKKHYFAQHAKLRSVNFKLNKLIRG